MTPESNKEFKKEILPKPRAGGKSFRCHCNGEETCCDNRFRDAKGVLYKQNYFELDEDGYVVR